jgi:hypothetical protein
MLFFPEIIMQLMNLVISVLLYTGSGRVSRFGTSLRLGIPKGLLQRLSYALLFNILSLSGTRNAPPESENMSALANAFRRFSLGVNPKTAS